MQRILAGAKPVEHIVAGRIARMNRGALIPVAAVDVQVVGHVDSSRVPGAVRHSSCRSAEPGPYQTPALVTTPALQRTAPQELRAALRPGHERRSITSRAAPPRASTASRLPHWRRGPTDSCAQ